MGQTMQLDTEAISAATNKITADVAALGDAMNTFIGHLSEKVQDTQGNFSLLATLETKLKTEQENVAKLSELTDEITLLTRRYVEQAEEANDDSAFRD